MALKSLTVLGLAAAVTAFDSISVPSSVTAGKSTTLTIKNDIGSSDSFDGQFAYFRAYLTISPPGWGINPVCYLANETAVDKTTLQITIPASVGPSADNYTISVIEYNTDPDAESSSSGFQYSDAFSLVGGTGVFSDYELDPSGPWSLGPENSIPCSAYDCVRQCQQKDYPADLPSGSDVSAYKRAYMCSSKCPGTTYPEWDPSWDDEMSSSMSSSPSATATESATHTGVKPTGSAATDSATATETATTASTSSSTSTSTSATGSATDAPGAGNVSGVSKAVAVVGLLAGLAMRM